MTLSKTGGLLKQPRINLMEPSAALTRRSDHNRDRRNQAFPYSRDEQLLLHSPALSRDQSHGALSNAPANEQVMSMARINASNIIASLTITLSFALAIITVVVTLPF